MTNKPSGKTSLTGKPSAVPSNPHPPTNLRELRRQTDRNLIMGGLIILFVIGGGLIWLLYGAGQALSAVLCMGGVLAVFSGLYWFVSKLLKALSDSNDE